MIAIFIEVLQEQVDPPKEAPGTIPGNTIYEKILFLKHQMLLACEYPDESFLL